MESPESFPAAADAANESTPARRIAIGTQRAGAKPPSLAPKYQYISPPAAKPQAAEPTGTDAALESAVPQPVAAAPAPTAPTGDQPAPPAGGR
ncbi:MAG: hypothetical protein WCC69_14220, partial [Pirellulales bacterium]